MTTDGWSMSWSSTPTAPLMRLPWTPLPDACRTMRRRTFAGGTGSTDIGAQAAKAAALKHAGLSESQVRELQAEWDNENGRAVYEVEFKSGGMEYDYVIDAATGAVLDHEVERDD